MMRNSSCRVWSNKMCMMLSKLPANNGLRCIIANHYGTISYAHNEKVLIITCIDLLQTCQMNECISNLSQNIMQPALRNLF